MNILNSFPVKLCLTQAERKDRQILANGEFRAQGIEGSYFYALPGDTPKHSFNRSQYAMIKQALSTVSHKDEDTQEDVMISHALFFEDDVIFRNCTHLPYAFEQLPQDWDVLYLGANITNGTPEKVDKYICRVKTAWTTHAIAYSRRVMQFISDYFDPNLDFMYDDWLEKRVLSNFNCYIVNPMVCWQRPVRSDLWGRDVDYTDCFIKGDEIMSNL